ncbi:hypothetical protein BJV74DRAFT_869963 [Russula compacta]|nr:hypothetical protein BJV74DRAFT_869963 [Russula compacta]
MANARSDPHDQQDHIPSTSNGPGPAGQWQNATWPDANFATQGCSCPWCSENDPRTRRTMVLEDPSLPGGPAGPYVDQYLGVDNTTGIPAAVSNRLQAEFAAPPLAFPQWNRENQAQVLGLSAMESLRRLAGLYVNNPESLVNAVRLEPGPSRRFQVVIMLEIADIL